MQPGKTRFALPLAVLILLSPSSVAATQTDDSREWRGATDAQWMFSPLPSGAPCRPLGAFPARFSMALVEDAHGNGSSLCLRPQRDFGSASTHHQIVPAAELNVMDRVGALPGDLNLARNVLRPFEDRRSEVELLSLVHLPDLELTPARGLRSYMSAAIAYLHTIDVRKALATPERYRGQRESEWAMDTLKDQRLLGFMGNAGVELSVNRRWAFQLDVMYLNVDIGPNLLEVAERATNLAVGVQDFLKDGDESWVYSIRFGRRF